MSRLSSGIDLELEAAAAEIVKRLGGVWSPRGAMCHCPAHADHSPSLSVRVGTNSLLFKCFAGCDTIDVLRAIRRLKLDIPSDDQQPRDHWRPRGERVAARIRGLWDEARPFAGSPAQIYASGRGLIGSAGTLRYHPQTPIGKGASVRFRPALLAAVRSGDRVVAVERLFLDVPPSLPARDLDPPKRLLGRPLDGAVRFGLPSTLLGLAEGWETAWSARILLGIPVWATLGSERFPHVSIPDCVERLILLPDDDAAGVIGSNKALEAHARPGRSIELLLPEEGFNDWNDQLRARRSLSTGGGEEGGMGMRKAA